MKKIIKPVIFICFLYVSVAFTAFNRPEHSKPSPSPIQKNEHPKIQVAILLDVSNSMDGLIGQAKAQLWNMVSTLGKAKCDGNVPVIEIALYEYGRPENGAVKGFVKELSGFSTDLDKLSQLLFNIRTNGGDEFCGKVILTSLEKLNWDASANSYKVIFIAGNEDFLQGNVTYTEACNVARKKGVIVNTIYCGDRQNGIREHWNLSSECGNGSFTNINQDAKIEDIPTPYDSLILTLNEKLNGTYIAYGNRGYAAKESQASLDKMNYTVSKSAAVSRASVKGKKDLYKNPQWDMVDAAAADEQFLSKVDGKTLPDSLKNKNAEELKTIVLQKKKERTLIQNEIGRNAASREKFLIEEKSKNVGTANVNTLATEIEKIIKKQAALFKMVIP